ncbi:MAG TPA: hypothetical protein VGG25_13900 [Streptosporangiaceae bacterium]
MARPGWEVRHEPGCCGRCGAGLAGPRVTGVAVNDAWTPCDSYASAGGHQLF